jgi:hypothetical protein
MSSLVNFYRSGQRTGGDRLRPFLNACRRFGSVARDGEFVDDVLAAKDAPTDIEKTVAQAQRALRHGQARNG